MKDGFLWADLKLKVNISPYIYKNLHNKLKSYLAKKKIRNLWFRYLRFVYWRKRVGKSRNNLQVFNVQILIWLFNFSPITLPLVITVPIFVELSHFSESLHRRDLGQIGILGGNWHFRRGWFFSGGTWKLHV